MLFVPYPAFGHVNPMLPVIRELVRRGVRVRVVADGGHAAALSEVSAQVVPLSVRPDVYVPARVSHRVARYVGARSRKWAVDRDAAVLVRAEVARDRPSLVVVDPMMGGADRAARRAGVATALFSTTYAGGDVVPAWWGRDGSAGLGSLVVNRLPRRRFRHDRLVLANTVPQLQPSATVLGEHVRFVGPLVRDELDVDLSRFGLPAAGRALFVSPGTVFARGPEFFATVARAFAGTDWWVVMSTGAVDPAVLTPLPHNVIAVRRVPQLAVLGQTDVFLTHAGMNSALEAMALGVPMIVSPRAGDQRFVARRLVELGLAHRLPDTPELLRAAVERIAEDPVVRFIVNRWRERLAGLATASAAADLLLEHASAGSGSL